MKHRKLIYILGSVVIVSLSLNLFFLIKKDNHADVERIAVQGEEDVHKEPEEVAGEKHEHGGHETSDENMSPEELFAKKCEHNILQAQCDECRYELGLVKIPRTVFDKSLLKTEPAGMIVREKAVTLNGNAVFNQKRKSFAYSPVEGVVSRLFVRNGELVKKGSLLMEITSSELAAVKGSYLAEKAALELAEKNFARIKELFDAKIVSEKEYLEAQAALKNSKIRFQTADAALAATGLSAKNLEKSNNISGTFVVTSPADGTVNAVRVFQGEHADKERELAEIGNTSEIVVEADIYEHDLKLIETMARKTKLNALISAKAYKDEVFEGLVYSISQFIDEKTRTAKVYIDVKNSGARLKPGMFVTAKLFVPDTGETLGVSNSALMSDEGKDFVFIHYKNDFYLRRFVKKGMQFSQQIEITEGIKVGDKVVTNGAFLLKSDVLRSKMGAGCAD